MVPDKVIVATEVQSTKNTQEVLGEKLGRGLALSCVRTDYNL